MARYINDFKTIDNLINNNVKNISIIIDNIIDNMNDNMIDNTDDNMIDSTNDNMNDNMIDNTNDTEQENLIKRICCVIRDILMFNTKKIEGLKSKIIELDMVIKQLTKDKNSLTKENSSLHTKILNFESILDTRDTCCICLIGSNNYINIKCGHKSICKTCLDRINSTCPICKQIGEYIKVFE